MLDTRLALGLEAGVFRVPDTGQIAVFNPPLEAQLAALDPARVEVIEGFKPAHDLWLSRGFACRVAPQETYAAVIVCLPRAKAQARAVIAQALQISQGAVVVDGQKTDGVDSVLKAMRQRVEVSAPISKAHGKLFLCTDVSPDIFEDWVAGPSLTAGGFWTAPGVFSADAIDPASALLAEALPEDLGKEVADLGAGWGFLSAHVLTRDTVTTAHLVEAEHMALECARRNVTDPRAAYHWADATRWQSASRIDTVVMNPPFHTSRTADPALGRSFVEAAARLLSPQGQLWMVANRHLPYEETLKDSFANVFETGGDARFKLFHAVRPKRAKHRQAV